MRNNNGVVIINNNPHFLQDLSISRSPIDLDAVDRAHCANAVETL